MSNSANRDIAKADFAEKQRRALELRKAGASYEQIAEAVGYSDRAGAHKAVAAAIKNITREPARDVLTLELERLDTMLVGLWPEARRGNAKAIDRVIRIMDRRASYLGLDAETSIAVTNTALESWQAELLNAAKEMRAKLKEEDSRDGD